MSETNLTSNSVTPVILAGGSGTRLWPLSRKTYPKQFSNLIGETSLFQKTALRFMTSSRINFECPIILTNSVFRFIVSDQLSSISCNHSSIIIEPSVKNTAPAILAATISSLKKDPDSILLFVPADHVIPDETLFCEAVDKALAQIAEQKIVTFGIQPTSAETGYGYLELGERLTADCFELKNFCEKPDKITAKGFLSGENHMWNAGIFMCRATDMLEAFKKYASDLVPHVTKSVERSRNDLDFLRLDEKSWEHCRDVSVDYAIMERADNLVAIRYDGAWSDLGNWNAIADYMIKDENAVALSSNAHAIECENTMLRSENENQHIVGLGLKDMIAVAMPDAVLVTHKDRSQDVKLAVNLLKKKNTHQAEIFPKDHRPWGWFESLSIGDRFQVKRIMVKPGASLSLQSHHHRSEHWIVVAGTASVTIDEQVKLISEGESVHIPLGAKHRMENPGKVPMLLIEVQIGTYLGEDDIVRYEDRYDRR